MRIPPSFFNAAGRILLFIALEALCLFLIARDGVIERFLLNRKIEAVQSFFWEKNDRARKYFKLYRLQEDIAGQNAVLLSENSGLKAIIERLEGDSLLLHCRNINDDTLSIFEYDWAKVVKNKLNSGHNYVILNKGASDGITEDMGVVTAEGVVGIIRSVGENYSVALSFLNPTQQISAKLGRKNAFGILSWDGKSANGALLTDIQQHIEINNGDTVYTSGHSAIFPADIPLGVVKESKLTSGMHKSAKVELFQDYTLLDYVFVVRNRDMVEIDSLSGLNKR